MRGSVSLAKLPRQAALSKRGVRLGCATAVGRHDAPFLALAVGGSFVRFASGSSTMTPPTPTTVVPQAQLPSTPSRSLHSTTSQSRPEIVGDNNLSPIIPAAPVPEASSNTHGYAEAMAPLAKLPTAHILRSLMTTTISSSPSLLPPSLAAMSVLANTTSRVLSPETNPVLRAAIKSTLYRQFCAGENALEIAATAKQLRSIGFSGIILNYAREVIVPKTGVVDPITSREEYSRCVAEEVIPWASGQIETVRLAQEGDFVAVKFSGAGKLALASLARREAPPPEILGALDAICLMASRRGINLLFDAEQFSVQGGIDDWTIDLMRRYNTETNKAFVYNTYQCYLKSTPENLSNHLAIAQKEGFTLGVKLVRGAYMGIDPAHLFWGSKAETDACFDNVTAGLMRRQWGDMVKGTGFFPDVGLCLATHNAQSVRLAQQINKEGSMTELSIAQLQGMADEISCELLADPTPVQKAKAFKYLTWGTTGECMKYLLRRAQENKDAVQRTKDTRDAMASELVRRVKGMFGFA